MSRNRYLLISLLTVLFVAMLLPRQIVTAQVKELQCGDVIKSEFTTANELQRYVIKMAAEDELVVTGKSDNPKLKFGIVILMPTMQRVAWSEPRPGGYNYTLPVDNPSAKTGLLSAYGTYSIYVANTPIFFGEYRDGEAIRSNDEWGAGAYQIRISCTVGGKQINPGDPPPPPPVKPDNVKLAVPITQTRGLTTVQCGDVLAAEFLKKAEVHNYALEMAVGDKDFQVSLEPVGDYLSTAIAVVDPTGRPVKTSAYTLTKLPFVTTDASAPGIYRIFVSNTRLNETGAVNDPDHNWGGIGSYSLMIGCTLKGDKKIMPSAKATQAPTAAPASAATSTGSGPAALDVSKLIKIPLVSGTPMSGAVTATGGEAFGYGFEAKANASLNLTLTRLTGNLNLGVAILSEDGKVTLFQSNLLATKTINAQLAIPADGKYIVAVYRTDPVPDGAQATAFTVQTELK